MAGESCRWREASVAGNAGDPNAAAKKEGEKGILIVEDDAAIARYIKVVLHQHGYRVASIVATGGEAVVATFACRPDLVLMDIRLGGGIDGIDAAILIRESFRVQIVFMSALATAEIVARAGQAEPSDFVVKPFKGERLIRAVEKALAGYIRECAS